MQHRRNHVLRAGLADMSPYERQAADAAQTTMTKAVRADLPNGDKITFGGAQYVCDSDALQFDVTTSAEVDVAALLGALPSQSRLYLNDSGMRAVLPVPRPAGAGWQRIIVAVAALAVLGGVLYFWLWAGGLRPPGPPAAKR